MRDQSQSDSDPGPGAAAGDHLSGGILIYIAINYIQLSYVGPRIFVGNHILLFLNFFPYELNDENIPRNTLRI